MTRAGSTAHLVSAWTGWFDLAVRSWQMAADAQIVVGLRLARLAVGDAGAAAEAQRMVAEKAKAAVEVQGLLWSAAATGSRQGPKRAVAHLHRRVRANRKRLSKRVTPGRSKS
jgi:hypothetical protein